MIYAKSGENHPITSDEIFEQILNRIIQLPGTGAADQ